jgi:hypothetical protein
VKIISGGQTGADRTALEVARELGIPTGGYAPKHWMTEDGRDPTLKEFGLIECRVPGYPIRTVLNVDESHGTVWFGKNDSAGYVCTKSAVDKHRKPWIENPTADELRYWLDVQGILELNVAGNRRSRNPGVVQQVREVLTAALSSPGLLRG